MFFELESMTQTLSADWMGVPTIEPALKMALGPGLSNRIVFVACYARIFSALGSHGFIYIYIYIHTHNVHAYLISLDLSRSLYIYIYMFI